MISPGRASELALLCLEAALAARAPDAGTPPRDLVEWAAGHAAAAPGLGRLPHVARLLRSSAACPEAAVASPGPAGARSGFLVVCVREAAERLAVTERGARWLAGSGRLPGARRNRVTGRWEIPGQAVAAYGRARGES